MSLVPMIKQFGINLVSNFAVNQLGLNDFNNDYIWLKHGTLIYLVSRAQAMALGLNPSWNVEDILNEIAFNSLSVLVVNELNLTQSLARALNLDTSSDMGIVVIQSVLMSAIQEVGYFAESHPDFNVVRRLVSFARSKLNV